MPNLMIEIHWSVLLPYLVQTLLNIVHSCMVCVLQCHIGGTYTHTPSYCHETVGKKKRERASEGEASTDSHYVYSFTVKSFFVIAKFGLCTCTL